MPASIKFRAMKNVGPRTLTQFKRLNNGPFYGVMRGHIDIKVRAYASYAITNGVVQGWASLVDNCWS